MFKLILRDNEGGEAQFPITGELYIGRSDDCDIILQDPKVSRKHAKVLVQGLGAVIEDLDSSNGTYVNNDLVEQPRQLNSGDLITIGANRIRVTETNPLMDYAHTTKVGLKDDDQLYKSEQPESIHRPIPQRVAEDPFVSVPDKESPTSIDQERPRRSIEDRYPPEKQHYDGLTWLVIGATAVIGVFILFMFLK